MARGAGSTGSKRSTRSARHHKAIQEQAKAVLDQHGVKMFRAQVAGLFPDGKVNLRRGRNRRPGEAQAAADGVPSARLDPAQELAVGDWVWCLQAGGHAFVVGRVVGPSDLTAQALKRHADGLDAATRQWAAEAELQNPALGAGWTEVNPVRFRKTKGGIVKAMGRIRNTSGSVKPSGSRLCGVLLSWTPPDNHMWSCARFPAGSNAASESAVAPVWLDTATGNLNTGCPINHDQQIDLANVVWWTS